MRRNTVEECMAVGFNAIQEAIPTARVPTNYHFLSPGKLQKLSAGTNKEK